MDARGENDRVSGQWQEAAGGIVSHTFRGPLPMAKVGVAVAGAAAVSAAVAVAVAAAGAGASLAGVYLPCEGGVNDGVRAVGRGCWVEKFVVRRGSGGRGRGEVTLSFSKVAIEAVACFSPPPSPERNGGRGQMHKRG